MKTKISVEIETPDKCEVFPEEGQSEEDFKGKEKELEDFRKQYTKDLHQDVVRKARTFFDDGQFEENWLDNVEELSVDGYDSFKDYGVKVKTTKSKI